MADDDPRRGEVRLIAFEGRGGGMRKTRPAAVVSDDLADARLNRVQAVPLSSRVERVHPAEAVVVMGGLSRKAMADRITTADRGRLMRRLAVLGAGDLGLVSRVIRIQLGL